MESKYALLNALNLSIWKFRNKFSPVYEYEYNSEGEVLNDYTPIEWTSDAIKSLIISSICGAFLGVIVSICVNTVLIEIPASPSFTFYFACLFIIFGFLVLWKTLSVSITTAGAEDPYATPRRHLIVFSVVNILTGFFCFTLKRTSLIYLSSTLRFLAYGFLGMSTAFALTYALLDLINFLVGFFRPEMSHSLVESFLQIYVIIISSLLHGFIFGILFCLRDVSKMISYKEILDSSTTDSKIFFLKFIDDRLCFIIGVLCGGLIGLANEYIARVEASYNKLDQPVGFDDEI